MKFLHHVTKSSTSLDDTKSSTSLHHSLIFAKKNSKSHSTPTPTYNIIQ